MIVGVRSSGSPVWLDDLRKRLGREPTPAELDAEVARLAAEMPSVRPLAYQVHVPPSTQIEV